jgi:hypothetical protein
MFYNSFMPKGLKINFEMLRPMGTSGCCSDYTIGVGRGAWGCSPILGATPIAANAGGEYLHSIHL